MSVPGVTLVEAAANLEAACRAAFESAARAMAGFARKLPRLEIRVRDPAGREAHGLRECLLRAVDVVRHDFWMAADRPERSPGAYTVLRWPGGKTQRVARP